MQIEFIVPGKPQGKARARTVRQGANTHSYTPDNTVKYETLVKSCFRHAWKKSDWKFTEGPLMAEIIAFYQIPKSWSKKKKQEAWTQGIPPTVKPDCDNVIKIILDALNGIAYKDDNQVVKIKFQKLYATKGSVRVRLSEIKR